MSRLLRTPSSIRARRGELRWNPATCSSSRPVSQWPSRETVQVSRQPVSPGAWMSPGRCSRLRQVTATEHISSNWAFRSLCREARRQASTGPRSRSTPPPDPRSCPSQVHVETTNRNDHAGEESALTGAYPVNTLLGIYDQPVYSAYRMYGVCRGRYD